MDFFKWSGWCSVSGRQRDNNLSTFFDFLGFARQDAIVRELQAQFKEHERVFGFETFEVFYCYKYRIKPERSRILIHAYWGVKINKQKPGYSSSPAPVLSKEFLSQIAISSFRHK